MRVFIPWHHTEVEHMQISTDMAYQGSTPKTDDIVSYANIKETMSKVTENTVKTEAEKTEEKKQDIEEPVISIQSKETLKKAVNEINQKTNTEAVFGFHDATNRITIKIIDKESKEVVREYPPEETLDMIAKVWELAGILVDEKR